MNIQIKPFDFRNASEAEYKAYNKLRNQIQAERLPDDPPVPLEETIQRMQHAPPESLVKILFWIAWDENEEAVGYTVVQMGMTDNLHLVQFSINVLPEYRHQGLGKQFLAKVVQTANDNDRSQLISSTMASVPDGEGFLAHIGAESKLAGHTNQLKISELDRDILVDWQARAAERAGGFELGWWFGDYPAEDMEAILELYDLMNQQPFGDLDVEDSKFSEEMLREMEKSMRARGTERWTLYTREKESGSFAGYTEVMWNPNRPEIVQQGITGVFPQYRNNGLGRWLKAAMLDKVLTERPDVKFIRTENADSNAPMLKINNELGFKPYIAESFWQVSREKVEEYLAA
jgi:mycothiol synthase